MGYIKKQFNPKIPKSEIRNPKFYQKGCHRVNGKNLINLPVQ
jgi:hypothetical protein